ncbi:MAG: hypothetical protein ABI685_03895 [Ferruginibacter sp.]
MKDKKEHIPDPLQQDGDKIKAAADGYPSYPAKDDIYNKSVEEENIDPEDVSKLKEPDQTDTADQANEKDFDEDKSGDDLDVPGADLDDEQEAKGSEDEENNYYSLGGDNHNDLDEGRD